MRIYQCPLIRLYFKKNSIPISVCTINPLISTEKWPLNASTELHYCVSISQELWLVFADVRSLIITFGTSSSAFTIIIERSFYNYHYRRHPMNRKTSSTPCIKFPWTIPMPSWMATPHFGSRLVITARYLPGNNAKHVTIIICGRCLFRQSPPLSNKARTTKSRQSSQIAYTRHSLDLLVLLAG